MISFTKAALVASLIAVVASASESFTVRSEPLNLRYGQVNNNNQGVLKLPQEIIDRYADRKNAMAMTSFTTDIVYRNGTSVPLYNAYFHHYILYAGSYETVEYATKALHRHHGPKMNPELMRDVAQETRDKFGGGNKIHIFGGASGAEFRNNPHNFKDPFYMILQEPNGWSVTLHVINTRNPRGSPLYNGNPSPLLQCPCTPQRKIDVAEGTIDGSRPRPPFGCTNPTMLDNPSCNLATYVGGWRCCDDRVFLVDTDKECSDSQCSELPVDEIFVEYTFTYMDVPYEQPGIQQMGCCDVTTVNVGNGNIEYDVPQCAPGTPPSQCTHTVETVQPLDAHNPFADASRQMYLTFAAPHLHVSGLSLDMIDDETGETLCSVNRENGGVVYGTSTTEVGNEQNYIVGLIPCSWGKDDAKLYKAGHPIRTRAVYNNTRAHSGVMSLWLSDGAPYYNAETCAAAVKDSDCTNRFRCDACISDARASLYDAGCSRDVIDNIC